MAEIDFFRNKFEEAAERLLNITKNPNSDITNDALTLLVFLQENGKNPDPGIADFAKASFFIHQRKLSEAVGILASIVTKDPNTKIGDEIFMLEGDALTAMQRYGDAIGIYEKLISQYSESTLLDRAQMKIGYLYQAGIRDTLKAIAAYQTLLEKFPNSIYQSEARKRIRELRGDTI
ncbi:MAG: tetratricopeptide repeat protein [Methylococcales bacterium]